MEIMMVQLSFGDGLDDEHLLYGVNKHQMGAAKEAVKRAKEKYDRNGTYEETFEDAVDTELKKAGVRFKHQNYEVEWVDFADV